MTRLIDQAIEVSLERGTSGAPDRFRWRGSWYQVQRLLDLWTEAGAWWDGDREATFFRVLIDGESVCELIREPGGRWRLYRIYD